MSRNLKCLSISFVFKVFKKISFNCYSGGDIWILLSKYIQATVDPVISALISTNFQIMVVSLQHGFKKQVPQQISANKRNFYWPNWVKTFQKWKAKGYDSETLAQKAKAWEEILTTFNSQNSNGVKRDFSQRQGCWRRLKLQSKREHDLHRREARKTGGVKALVLLK